MARSTAKQAADMLLADADALPVRDTPALRALRRLRSRQWKDEAPSFILGVALELVARRARRWMGYELVRCHAGAFAALSDRALARLAAGLDSWDSVDAFGRILSGAAWAQELASDALIERWSRSRDRWLRRAALVSTIGLNTPRDGGEGDAARTLAICDRLAEDRDDMVEKALSWALRALIARDAKAVRAFVAANETRLGARVKREVANKLRTGLKTPKTARQGPVRALKAGA
jgi:3-methyladenine DNA glycosylase AlkD